jgi:hypothetical protein
VVWTVLYQDRRAALALLVGAGAAAVTLYVFTPPWWLEPLAGIERFLHSNLTRANTTPIRTQFLGTIYETPTGSLPWYNTLVWIAMAAPVGLLTLAVVGVFRAFQQRRRDRLATLVGIHWAFLLLLRALPHTPGHDGIRQFLPAFGCLSLAAGLGARGAVERLGGWGRAWVILALIEAPLSTLLSLPVPLSYFSPAVGGLPGAARLGMEPTYYWDTLTPDVLRWINTHTDPGRAIGFSATPISCDYLRRSGKLRAGVFPEGGRSWQWYILQNRPGGMDELDRALVARARPSNVILSKWGVPLVWAFSRSEAEAVLRTRR